MKALLVVTSIVLMSGFAHAQTAPEPLACEETRAGEICLMDFAVNDTVATLDTCTFTPRGERCTELRLDLGQEETAKLFPDFCKMGPPPWGQNTLYCFGMPIMTCHVHAGQLGCYGGGPAL